MKKIPWKQHELTVYLPENTTPQLTIIVQDGDYLFEYFKQHPLEHIAFVGVEPIDRDKEYTPWFATVDDHVYEGESDTYLMLIIEELLPFLHEKFNLSIEPKNLGIAGGSFGGLVSLYALLTKGSCFDYYFLLSPSLWYPKFLSLMAEHPSINDEKHIFWYVGEREGVGYPNILRHMVPYTLKAAKLLATKLTNPNSTLQFITDAQGVHRHHYFEKYFQRNILQLEKRYKTSIKN